MKIPIRKDLLCIIFLLLIAIITHWQWFYYYLPFGWGDAQFFVRSNLSWISHVTYPQAWEFSWANGFGGYNIILSAFPIYFLMALFIKLGLSLAIAQKLLIFLPIVFLPVISSYLLIKELTKSNLGAISGSLVYSYNVYLLLTQAGGQFSIAVAYSLVSLALLLLIKCIKEDKIYLGILASIIGFGISTYDFRIFYIYAWISLGLLISLNLNRLKSGYFKEIGKSISIFGLSFLFWFGLSLFWILPLIISGSVTNNAAINRGLFGNQYMNFKQSLFFFHPFWTGGNGQALGVVQNIPEYFIFIPLLAILGAITNFRRPFFKFFIVIAVLGIILTKQTAPPFPDLYLWLYNYFPGFNAYRESSKFYLFLGLGYSILIGGCVSAIRSRFVRIIFLLIVAILFLYNTFPLINGQIKEMFTPKQIPLPYQQYEKMVHYDTSLYRTLWIPSFSQWSYFSLLHPVVDVYRLYFDNLVDLTRSAPNIVFFHANSVSTQVLKPFLLPDAQLILSQLGIRYIIVPMEDDQSNNIFQNYGFGNRNELVKFLDSLKYLEKKSLILGLEIYENKNYFSFVNIVNYQIINSTRVKIYPPYPDIVNYSQMFDSNWALVDGTKIISKASRTPLGLMQFTIPRGVKNKPLEIYFLPQRYAQIGTIISIVTAVLILGYLIKIWLNR